MKQELKERIKNDIDAIPEWLIYLVVYLAIIDFWLWLVIYA